MKVFLLLVVVAVLAVHFLDAETDGTTQANLTKDKQEAKEKSNAGFINDTPRNKKQTAQFSAGVNRPTNMQQLSYISSNLKVSSNIHQTGRKASCKLSNGIHLPAEVPTGIPADTIGKATKELKSHFRKTERNKLIADYIRLKRAKLDAKPVKEMETIE